MSSWVSIPNQVSMKYEIYNSIGHGNVIEQQIPGIHTHNQIGYTSTVITLNSHVWYTLYSVCSLCSIAYYNFVAEFLNHLKYKLLNCLTFDALTGRVFQTEAP